MTDTRLYRMATRRLTKEYARLQREPIPNIVAVPSERNILQWDYALFGPVDSDFAGGEYLGSLNFPPEYPTKPPSIRMHTPNGRFETGTRLCLSISDFHPESWSPSWGVSTILLGLLSFMLQVDQVALGTLPASSASADLRRRLARASPLANRSLLRNKQLAIEMAKYRTTHNLSSGAAGSVPTTSTRIRGRRSPEADTLLDQSSVLDTVDRLIKPEHTMRTISVLVALIALLVVLLLRLVSTS